MNMKKSRLIVSIVFLALTLITTITIIVNSFIRENVSAAMSQGLSNAVEDTFKPETTSTETFATIVRKSIGHFLLNGLNAGFATLALFFYGKDKFNHRGVLLPIGLFYGVLISGLSEFIQLFVEGRGGTWKDVGINSLGCLFFVFIIGLIYSIKFVIVSRKARQKENVQ